MTIFSSINMAVLLSAVFINTAHATAPQQTNTMFPRGCEAKGYAFDKNYLVINEFGDQSYYLIQNRSGSVIELERHELGDTFMSPPLHATLDSSNWAAFASDIQNLNFRCYKKEEENTSLVDCSQVLDVCQYPRVRFALSNMGNYWISINKTQATVIQDSVNKGIYLKW